MRPMNPAMFDQRQRYGARVTMFKEFMQHESEFTDLEMNFLRQNQPSYYNFLIEMCNEILRARRARRDEEFIVLRSYFVNVEVFGRMAFRQIANEAYFKFWRQLLERIHEPETQKKAFTALCYALTQDALKLDEWKDDFFNCLDLSCFNNQTANFTQQINVNPNEFSKIDMCRDYLKIFLDVFRQKIEYFTLTFPLFHRIIKTLYVDKNKRCHVDDIAHACVIDIFRQLSLEQVVYLSRYNDMLQYLRFVIEEIAFKVLNASSESQNFNKNFECYRKLVEFYITSPHAYDLASHVGRKVLLDENIHSVSSEELLKFQKDLLLGLELMIMNFEYDKNQNSVMVLSEIKQVFTSFLDRASQICESLKILLCKISRTIIWRISFFKQVNAKSDIRHSISGSSELQMAKASDFAFNALPIWVSFMRDQKEWDLFLQKCISIFQGTFFNSKMNDVFSLASVAYIKLMFKIDVFEVSAQHQRKLFEPKTKRLTAYRFETFSINDMQYIWKQIFEIYKNATHVSSGKVMEEWAKSMKDMMEYFLFAEEVTGDYTTFKAIEVFAPFFISIIDNQTKDEVIKVAINSLNELFIRPMRITNDVIYQNYFNLLHNVMKNKEDIVQSFIPTMGNLFTYDLPAYSIIPQILNAMRKYKATENSSKYELETLNLLISICLYEQQHELFTNNGYYEKEFIPLISECYESFASAFTEKRNAVFWAIGITIVINTLTSKKPVHNEFKPLLDILLSLVRNSPCIHTTIANVLVFIVRQVGGIDSFYLSYISSALIDAIVNVSDTSDKKEQRTLLLLIIEILESNVMYSLEYPSELIDSLAKLIICKKGENLELIEIISSLLFRSMQHQKLSELNPNIKIDYASTRTTHWNIGSSLLSITPLEREEQCEVIVRDATGSWRFVVSISQDDIQITKKTIPTLQCTNDFKYRQKEKASIVLTKELDNDEIKKMLDWKHPRFFNRENAIDLTKPEYTEIQSMMDIMETDHGELQLVPPRSFEHKTNPYLGYVLSTFMQYPYENESVKHIQTTPEFVQKLKQIDKLGMDVYLPTKIYGNEFDNDFKEFCSVLISEKGYSSVGINKKIILEKHTNNSKVVIVYGEKLDEYSRFINEDQMIIQVIPRAHLALIKTYNVPQSDCIGPLFDNMIIRMDVVIPLIKEALIAKNYKVDDNLLVKRFEQIAESKPNEEKQSFSTYFSNTLLFIE